MVRDITGVCIVNNQFPTISLAIGSLSEVCKNFVIIDNESDDGTLSEIESARDDLDLNADIYVESGNAASILFRYLENIDGFAFRFEGDQIFFRDRTLDALEYRDSRLTVNTKSIMIRNRYDLRNSNYDTNAAHPTIFDADSEFKMRPNIQWPRGDYGGSKSLQRPISVNCRVNTPEERLKRWHWDCWRWKDKAVPENFRIEGVSQPYQNHMTLEDYVWKLRERGRGSSQWEGDSLREIGLNYLKWDTENNCRPYDGEYPEVLERHIEEFGCSGVVDALDEISV